MPYTHFIKKDSVWSGGHQIQETLQHIVFYFLTEGNKNMPFSVPGCGGQRAGRGSKMLDLRILL